ncbi:hypothetical protein [Roseivivax marinus]|uniref:DUF1281 family ferredoxin-like fold protein n=1 Tax=Roseivivax marinus TaxID=1379903 RepID=UPI00273D94CF|nr:hypothetical protein [Roseivivax marinus]
MANVCFNIISVSGNRESLERLREKVRRGSEPFCFDAIVPMPPLLNHIIEDRDAYERLGKVTDKTHHWVRFDGHEIVERRQLSEFELRLLDRIEPKTADWWCVTHWGCKWEVEDVDTSENDDGIHYDFYTPWEPPVGVVKALRAQFPDLKIDASYEIQEDEVEGQY